MKYNFLDWGLIREGGGGGLIDHLRYIESFQNDFSNLQPRKSKNRDNLSKEERKALNNLKVRDDIIITHADKGGAVVIISVKDYITEADRQLKDKKFYAELNHDPTKHHAELINETIRTFTKGETY